MVEEPYEAFLAREEVDDWRDRAVQEGRIIGDLNGEINDLMQLQGNLRILLYRAVRELEYVQQADGSNWRLFGTSEGKEIIQLGMDLLGIKDLALSWEEFAKEKRASVS